MIEILGSAAPWSGAGLSLAADVALKATVLLLVTLSLHLLLRNRSALVCSTLWHACLVGLLLLPVVTLASPRLRIDWLPARPDSSVVSRNPSEPEVIDAPSPTLLTTSASEEKADLRPETDRALNALPTRGGGLGGGDALAEAIRLPDALAKPLPSATPALQTWRIDWALVCLSAYMLIALALAIRLVRSLIAVRALRRTTANVDNAAWVAELDRWRRALGISHAVALARSTQAGVPSVVGWLRPMIVLPDSLAESESSGLIEAVLLHELAHVRRGDYMWNFLSRVVSTVYWPHPLAWAVPRLISGVREQACDDLCIHSLGDARQYRSTLVEVATNLVRAPGAALGMAMARTSKLGQRLARLEHSRGSSRCVLGRAARLTIAAAVSVVVVLMGSVEFGRRAAAASDACPVGRGIRRARQWADTVGPGGQENRRAVGDRAG